MEKGHHPVMISVNWGTYAEHFFLSCSSKFHKLVTKTCLSGRLLCIICWECVESTQDF
ncbi:hypothetical protein OIU78_019811 [Salix suchowensis]|nr:hypothetical protein OIU78_019811 [Salix suchowensis]